MLFELLINIVAIIIIIIIIIIVIIIIILHISRLLFVDSEMKTSTLRLNQ